jgi:hypothetical protein
MKTYQYTFTMPDSNGQPMSGKLRLKREVKPSETAIARKVAKTYGIAPGSVQGISLVSIS